MTLGWTLIKMYVLANIYSTSAIDRMLTLAIDRKIRIFLIQKCHLFKIIQKYCLHFFKGRTFP